MSRNLKKPGYTLIEMLITITIFSGLLVLVLGSFASTSSSSAKVNTLRNKSQAARKIVDQITNDFRFVDVNQKFKESSNFGDCEPLDPIQPGSCLYGGFLMNADRLLMVMKYPNDINLVVKEYNLSLVSERMTITLKESRDCTISLVGSQLSCPNSSSSAVTDILSDKYVVSKENGGFSSAFGGLTTHGAKTKVPAVTPYVSIVLTIKPFDQNSIPCSSTSGVCYKLETKLTTGSQI